MEILCIDEEDKVAVGEHSHRVCHAHSYGGKSSEGKAQTHALLPCPPYWLTMIGIYRREGETHMKWFW